MKTENEVGHHMASSTLNVDAFRDYLETQLKGLPPLPDVEQISPRVIRVLGQNPGEVRTRTERDEIAGVIVWYTQITDNYRSSHCKGQILTLWEQVVRD